MRYDDRFAFPVPGRDATENLKYSMVAIALITGGGTRMNGHTTHAATTVFHADRKFVFTPAAKDHYSSNVLALGDALAEQDPFLIAVKVSSSAKAYELKKLAD